MKITDVSSITVDNFRTNWVFVVITLEDGTRGIGESTLIGTEASVTAMIELLGARLIGQSVFDVGVLHARMQRESYWLIGPVVSAAISALDIAMWDAKARVLDVPLHTLLGGAGRRGIPAYANGWYVGAKTPAEFAEKARQIVDKGFGALKWDPFKAAHGSMTRRQINEAMDYVAAVRNAVGRDIDILIEAHGRFDLNTGIEASRALEEFHVSWIEEPIPPGRMFEMADLRRAVNVPVAAGERCYSRFDVANLIRAGAVDVLQPDIVHIGGFTEMLAVQGLASSASLPMSPHNPNGPVCHAASMHMAMAWGGVNYLEIMVTDVPWRRAIVEEACTFRDGCLYIPDRPGLGLELDFDQARLHPYQAHQLRHFSGQLTAIRPPDAVAWYDIESAALDGQVQPISAGAA